MPVGCAGTIRRGIGVSGNLAVFVCDQPGQASALPLSSAVSSRCCRSFGFKGARAVVYMVRINMRDGIDV